MFITGVVHLEKFSDSLQRKKEFFYELGRLFPVHRESDLLKDGMSSNLGAEDPNLMREEAQKMSSVLPTMWLGAQNGW